MVKFRALVPILIILLTNYVMCDSPEDVKKFGLQRARQSYRFNHPPTVEDEEQIPVPVVYDKVIDRSIRRQKLIQELSAEPPSIENINVPNEPQNIAEEKVTTEKNVLTKPEAREIKLSFKIPVSVVYDDEPVKENAIPSRTDTRLRKSGKRRRKPITESNEQSRESVIPTLRNRHNITFDAKPEHQILEETSPKPGSEEAPKIDLNKEKKRGQRRRRPQTRKSESSTDIVLKTTTEKAQERKNEQTTQAINSRINTEKIESSKVIQNTEPESIKLSATNQDTLNTVQTVDDSFSKLTKTNVPAHKREHGDPDPIVPIVASENHVYGNTGEYKYSYESGDGTKAFSNGKLKTSEFDEEAAGEAVEGGFSYKDKDGNDFSLSYTADENGYRPVGAHLPTPPPIPPAIARALAYLATKTTPEPITESLDEQEENTPSPNKTL